IEYFIVFSKYGKMRLKRLFKTVSSGKKSQIMNDTMAQILKRTNAMSNILDFRGSRLIYKRYASLYFCASIEENDNELITLELIQRYVQLLDAYFGNVCELDIIYGIVEAYIILDELLIAGEMAEPNLRGLLKSITKVSASCLKLSIHSIILNTHF
ncbi:hypothetical protein BATDEDRAFT_12684, partial [Batrachochytrium dendrobatidis JAM81]